MISIEDLVPDNHIFREIVAAIDFDFICDEVEGMYSDFDGGRPDFEYRPIILFDK